MSPLGCNSVSLGEVRAQSGEDLLLLGSLGGGLNVSLWSLNEDPEALDGAGWETLLPVCRLISVPSHRR